MADQEEKGGGLGLVFADAFLRGMRDIGYKDTGWAMCEEVDNSVQAGATLIAVRFGYAEANKTKVKPDLLALIDNGVGMIPGMISYAVRWGGTDREDSRKGFGRYGYGLPSSAVSFCKVYTVFSKVEGGEWHAVRVDIDELAAAANDIEETNRLLQPQEQEPPAWVMAESGALRPHRVRVRHRHRPRGPRPAGVGQGGHHQDQAAPAVRGQLPALAAVAQARGG